ncbi:MAG: alpha/beta fold hydrolase [Pseudomonadota bacterium]
MRPAFLVTLAVLGGCRFAAELAPDEGELERYAGFTSVTSLAAPEEEAGEPAADTAASTTVRVFYGTDRAPSGRPVAERFYGDDPSGALALGVAEVSIPPDHRTGKLERPHLWLLRFKANPERDITLTGLEPSSEDTWTRAVRETGARSAFVFVHGFNNSFARAAARTAQIAYDMDYDGVPMLFSWSSAGEALRYPRDAEQVELAIDEFLRFMDLAVNDAGLQDVAVVAHSMGGRLVAGALASLDAEQKPPFHLSQLILAAPDIPRKSFGGRLAKVLPRWANRVTLYASSRDSALALSHRYDDRVRLGEVASGFHRRPGIDGIDVSEVPTGWDSHRYFSTEPSILTDMHCLLSTGAPPDNRPILRPVEKRDTRWWRAMSHQDVVEAGIDLSTCGG